MKTIGLLGGMTCEPSLVYYKRINEIAREKLGGNRSAKSVMRERLFSMAKTAVEKNHFEPIIRFSGQRSEAWHSRMS